MVLAIYCAGGLGKQVLELAWSVNRWDKIIFVDDETEEKIINGIPVYRFEDLARCERNSVEFVIANGEPAYRETLYKKVKNAGYFLATIIPPWMPVLTGTKIGEGCIIFDAGISVDVDIGENVFIDSRVIIGHDATIKAHSVISAMVFIGGHTQVNERVFVSAGAKIKDRITIDQDAIISLGAVILRPVKAQAIMVGNPAKKIGDNLERRVFSMFK